MWSIENLFLDSINWLTINFGPTFGVAADYCNNVYIWGQLDDKAKTFIKPFIACNIDGIKDCQCSNDTIYLLKSNGTVLTILNVPKLLASGQTCTASLLCDLDGCNALKSQNIVKISTGDLHVAVLTSDGNLCMFYF